MSLLFFYLGSLLCFECKISDEMTQPCRDFSTLFFSDRLRNNAGAFNMYGLLLEHQKLFLQAEKAFQRLVLFVIREKYRAISVLKTLFCCSFSFSFFPLFLCLTLLFCENSRGLLLQCSKKWYIGNNSNNQRTQQKAQNL